jgi:hypothetical protein
MHTAYRQARLSTPAAWSLPEFHASNWASEILYPLRLARSSFALALSALSPRQKAYHQPEHIANEHHQKHDRHNLLRCER